MRRSVLIISGLLAVYAGWRFGMPYIDTEPGQDACIFGPISNREYRDLLYAARRRNETNWPSISGTPKDQASLIGQRIDDLTPSGASLYKRLAAIHAVLRERGASMINVGLHLTDGPLAAAQFQHVSPQKADDVAFNLILSYRANTLFVGSFDPVENSALVQIHESGYVARTELSNTGVLAPMLSDLIIASSSREISIRQTSLLMFLAGHVDDAMPFLSRPRTSSCADFQILQQLLK